MTTVLADAHAGVVVADTGASDGDRQWPGARKVWRSRGALLGFSGLYEQIEQFLAWYRDGALGDGPCFRNSSALLLGPEPLWLFCGSCRPSRVASGRDAIGTGGKAALSAHEAMGWKQPRRAVQIACRYDAASRAPVRLYRL